MKIIEQSHEIIILPYDLLMYYLLIIILIGCCLAFLWFWKFLRSRNGKIILKPEYERRIVWSGTYEDGDYVEKYVKTGKMIVDKKATKLANQKEEE